MSDSEHSDLEFFDEPDAGIVQPNNSTFDRLPLVPTDFTSVHEALQNFTVVFESRYGGHHPRFYSCSLRDALADAFDMSNKSPMDTRPFALYLHHDDSIAANIFAQNTLCGEAITPLLNCQFVLWPWDMTQEDNRNKFYGWMAEAGLTDIGNTVRHHSANEFPILLLITKERSTYYLNGTVNGINGTDECLQKLMHCVDDFQEIRTRAQREYDSRVEREQIRREQADEYEKSKAIDRARQQEQQRKRDEEMAEQKRIADEEERQRLHRAKLASQLPSEPEPSEPNSITLRLRFPSGEQKMRRFRASEKLGSLVCFVESLGYPIDQHRIWNSDFPRKDVSTLDKSLSFAQLDWPAREQITVEEK